MCQEHCIRLSQHSFGSVICFFCFFGGKGGGGAETSFVTNADDQQKLNQAWREDRDEDVGISGSERATGASLMGLINTEHAD